jgi:hypothetical protein
MIYVFYNLEEYTATSQGTFLLCFVKIISDTMFREGILVSKIFHMDESNIARVPFEGHCSTQIKTTLSQGYVLLSHYKPAALKRALRE